MSLPYEINKFYISSYKISFLFWFFCLRHQAKALNPLECHLIGSTKASSGASALKNIGHARDKFLDREFSHVACGQSQVALQLLNG